ncbi:MAG: DUF3459 domain-containing protein [Pirellulales bacterium]|nr:DUF3459 domain-containing protein [Pirellulales bacterium]
MSVRLERLYGDRAGDYVARIRSLLDRFLAMPPRHDMGLRPLWSERDVMLITYGDQVQSQGTPSLAVLHQFLLENRLDQYLNTIHLLPFFPYSSGDNFSVIDYWSVDPNLGTWNDVKRLGQKFSLAFDLVLNHVSRKSAWFQAYLSGEAPYDRFFIEIDPEADLSTITRPRSHPLRTVYKTRHGRRGLWTTFSEDQLDLNFSEPEVLFRMIEVLLEYIRHGARIIRLDAIAYLWKEIGTDCIHLEQTHEIVKLMRDILDEVAPDVLLLTETNVPHHENILYFGDGDEARLVYQFTLPPLLVDSFLNEDATILTEWIEGIETTPSGTTFLNFTASHDGIGIRPLEGLMDHRRFERLVKAIRRRGGSVSTRMNESGSHVPYELNISYLDALRDPRDPDIAQLALRFLASQGIMLALRGIPAVYFHSLVGTENDIAGFVRDGHPRSINRRKFQLDELEARLNDTESLAYRIFHGYRQLLAIRIGQPAFHPEAPQQVHRLADGVLAIQRTSLDGSQHILSLANLRREPVDVDLHPVAHLDALHNLFPDQEDVTAGRILLFPYQLAWLTNRPGS